MVLKLVWKNMRENWPEAATPVSRASTAALRLSALLERNAAKALAPLELSFTEFELLAALRASPAPHSLLPTELCASLLISSGGLTKVLKNLEARGLIARPSSKADRRRRPIALTSSGAALCERAMTQVQEGDQAAFAAAGVDEAALDALSQKLATAIDGFETPPAPED